MPVTYSWLHINGYRFSGLTAGLAWFSCNSLKFSTIAFDLNVISYSDSLAAVGVAQIAHYVYFVKEFDFFFNCSRYKLNDCKILKINQSSNFIPTL